MIRRPLLFFFSLGLFISPVGCGTSGPPNFKLSGTIKVKGEPAQNVEISLNGKDGQVYSARTSDDGAFTIVGVPSGEMVVTIRSVEGGYNTTGKPPTTSSPNQSGPKYAQGGKSGKQPEAPAMDPKIKEKMNEKMKEMEGKMPTPPVSTKVAAKFGNKEKSGLTWNVGPESQTKDFDLTE